ncbi:MAG: efflux RND transporter periplasmic adaptor subunit [Pseudomonadota bacterium]
MRGSVILPTLAAMALAGCSGESVVEEAVEPKTVKIATAQKSSSALQNTYPASVRSVRSTDLAFQVSGRVVVWRALEGTRFRKGDVIARLDDRSFRNAVTQAQAEFRNAQSEFERAQRLIEGKAISQSVLESRLAEREVAAAALDNAKKDLSDTVMRAPFTGTVGRTLIEEFQTVQAQSPVLTLQSQQVEAVVDVPGSFVVNAPRLRSIEAVVELDAAPGQEMPARFREAAGEADSSTQTFEAKFEFTPPPGLLVLNGMTARLKTSVEFADGIAQVPTGVAIPLSAVLQSEEKAFVWVIKPVEKTVSRRKVTLASSVGKQVVVKSGLKAGERIVASGGAYLNEGDVVREWQR